MKRISTIIAFAPTVTFSNNWNWSGNHLYYRVDANPYQFCQYFLGLFGGLRVYEQN